jgi:broad specificity phosphatase PhoE
VKIGLVRHFKVNHAFPKKWFLSKAEIEAWFEGYASAEVIPAEVELGGVEWQKCFSSSLSRSIHTANHFYKGDIIQLDVLQELNALPLLATNLRLPFLLWAIVVRLKYSSNDPVTVAFRQSIIKFVDELLQQEKDDVLIVSHGFVMTCIQNELTSRGFTGKKFGAPAHGKVYVFEK